MGKILYARAKQLLEAELDEELVALDVDGGQCFGFNSAAADIWRLLAQPRDFDSLRQSLSDQYDVDAGQCAADLKSCLAELEALGLVRATNTIAQ
jgi:hypothetical protein